MKWLVLSPVLLALAVGALVGLSIVAGLYALLLLLRILVWMIAVPVYGAYRYFAPILPSDARPRS